MSGTRGPKYKLEPMPWWWWLLISAAPAGALLIGLANDSTLTIVLPIAYFVFLPLAVMIDRWEKQRRRSRL